MSKCPIKLDHVVQATMSNVCSWKSHDLGMGSSTWHSYANCRKYLVVTVRTSFVVDVHVSGALNSGVEHAKLYNLPKVATPRPW